MFRTILMLGFWALALPFAAISGIPLAYLTKSVAFLYRTCMWVAWNGVRIAGYSNLPARLAADSSSLYAKNLLALIPLLTDKDSKAFAPAWDDEIIKGAALTKDGAVIHPNFTKVAA